MRISTAQMGKRAVTNPRPNKRLRWTIFLGFIALVYVGAFSVHDAGTAKGDKQVASTTETKSTGLPAGIADDIANYCSSDAGCINHAYAQIERDEKRCATDPDLQHLARSYCENFAIGAVVTNLKWGPGTKPIGLNNLAQLQRRLKALQRELN
jgi:hypothetical protein